MSVCPHLSEGEGPGPHLPHDDADAVHVGGGGVGDGVVHEHLMRQVREGSDLRMRHGAVHLHHAPRADVRQLHVGAGVHLTKVILHFVSYRVRGPWHSPGECDHSPVCSNVTQIAVSSLIQ